MNEFKKAYGFVDGPDMSSNKPQPKIEVVDILSPLSVEPIISEKDSNVSSKSCDTHVPTRVEYDSEGRELFS